jgi:hypothetical protein
LLQRARGGAPRREARCFRRRCCKERDNGFGVLRRRAPLLQGAGQRILECSGGGRRCCQAQGDLLPAVLQARGDLLPAVLPGGGAVAGRNHAGLIGELAGEMRKKREAKTSGGGQPRCRPTFLHGKDTCQAVDAGDRKPRSPGTLSTTLSFLQYVVALFSKSTCLYELWAYAGTGSNAS